MTSSESSISWREVKYNEVFEQELRALKRRKEQDKTCTIKDLEGVLQHLYIMEGAEGLGEVQLLSTAAIIAAHEHFIAQWKQED
ncbi:MAG: hypothetical protein FWG77_01250 [Treponema sp.]|nr:hypothetical protein [Treponema sp.]